MPRADKEALSDSDDGGGVLTLVYTRAPQTRLISLLGEAGAATLRHKLLAQTLAAAQAAAVGPVELYAAPDASVAMARIAAQHGVALVPQAGGDCGARMAHAFRVALHRHTRVIVVASHCAMLGASHLRQASDALDAGHDAVFVPTEDGGFALVGLARHHDDALPEYLFEGLPWHTDQIMMVMRDRLARLHWRWQALEMLWTIERPEDYRRWSELLLFDENQGWA